MKGYRLIPVALAMLAAGGCSIENPDTHIDNAFVPGEEMTFTAGFAAPDTKTEMHGESAIWWTPGDEICIWFGSSGEGNRFVSQETESTNKARFTGTINSATGVNDDGEPNYFLAVYPYEAAISCDGTSVVAELSSHQVAKPGSFAPNTNITLAKSTGLAMSFYNVCSGIRFSVTQEGVKSVTFTGNNNEDIAGTFSVSIGSDGKPTAPTVIEGKKYVTLSAPEGETLEVGPMYYIEILPQTLTNGFTMTFDTGTMEGSRSVTVSAPFNRNEFSRGLNFDASVSYSPYPTDEIRYTTTDDNIITPYNPDAFGANMVSNTYENGRGTLKFDANVTSIGASAFYYNRNLSTITIPNCVNLINPGAFQDTSLERFYGKYATNDGRFLIDDGLLLAVAGKDIYDLELPDEVNIIGKGSLQHLNDIRTVNIPERVTLQPGTEGNIFLRDENLERITGPFASEDGRYLVINGVLQGFAPANLTDITIPDGVTKIGKEVFRYGRGHFGTVTIPESVTEIGRAAFWEFEADRLVFKSTVPAIFEAQGSPLPECDLVVPTGYVETYRNATGWDIYHNQVTSEGCRIYYTSTDGNIVEPSEPEAFDVVLVSNTYGNGEGVMVFDGEITRMYGNAFAWNNQLKTIKLPETIEEVYSEYSYTNNPFVGCDSLEAIYSSMSSEDNRCLIQDGILLSFAPYDLTAYAVPDGVTKLAGHSLDCREGLKYLTLPESLTTIETYAVYCHGITTLVIPDNVTSIAGNAFQCENLKAFYGRYASTDGRALILDGVLCGFAPNGLTSYTLPEGITETGAEVFKELPLEEVTIPSTITRMMPYTFIYCTYLRKVTVLALTPPADAWEILAGADNAMIYVPAESVDAYKAASGWSEYSNRIFPIQEEGSTEPPHTGPDY